MDKVWPSKAWARTPRLAVEFTKGDALGLLGQILKPFRRPRHVLTVCAVMKDEGRYLAEWLAFHRAAGVDHFLVYDNESRDDTRAILERFGRRFPGTVTVVDWPGQPAQSTAYRDALPRLRRMTEWATFIDGDEYLFGTSEDLKAILAEVGAAALCVHWLIFGSSGRTEAPDGLNIESFTRRAREDADANQIYKSIIRPRRALDYVNAHRFTLNGPMVNERGEVLPPEGHRAKTPSHARIRINHYMVRSFAEWKLKQARGDPRPEGHPQKRRADGFFADYDRNEREDLCALRFRDAVVATLAELAGETPAKTS